MKSVRLDARQERRLRDAARATGLSQSEFIRKAIDRACDAALPGPSLYDLVKDIVDPDGEVPVPPELQTNDAERHSEIFGEILERKYAGQLSSVDRGLGHIDKPATS